MLQMTLYYFPERWPFIAGEWASASVPERRQGRG